MFFFSVSSDYSRDGLIIAQLVVEKKEVIISHVVYVIGDKVIGSITVVSVFADRRLVESYVSGGAQMVILYNCLTSASD